MLKWTLTITLFLILNTQATGNKRKRNNELVPNDGENFKLPYDNMLYPIDIASFDDHEWLTSRALNYAVEELIGRRKFHGKGRFRYLDADYGTFYLTGILGINPKSVLTNMKLNGKIIIWPFALNNNHWCLIIANTKEKTIRYYNPFDPSHENFDEEEEAKIQAFRDVFEKRNQFVENDEKFDTANWILETEPVVNIEKQKNANDCGIFVIRYIDLYTNGRATIDPINSREYIKAQIAERLKQVITSNPCKNV